MRPAGKDPPVEVRKKDTIPLTNPCSLDWGIGTESQGVGGPPGAESNWFMSGGQQEGGPCGQGEGGGGLDHGVGAPTFLPRLLDPEGSGGSKRGKGAMSLSPVV